MDLEESLSSAIIIGRANTRSVDRPQKNSTELIRHSLLGLREVQERIFPSRPD